MHPLLKLFADFSEKEGFAADSFIVGGAVRDIILAKKLKDIDIAVKKDAVNIARKFAEKINASFVLMDKDFGIARIVKDAQFIDICLMKGSTIYEDLADRDITINAMAIPLKNSDKLQAMSDKLKVKNSLLVTRYSLLNVVDPYNGFYDLTHEIIKMVSEGNLIKDPLRILRIYRFAASLNFFIEDNTLNSTQRLAPLITSIAVERIAEELRYIVILNDSHKTINALLNNSILFYIFPEFEKDFSTQNLELYRKVEDILNNPTHFSLTASCFQLLAFKKICLKLSTLFPNPDSAKQSAIRLKISKKEVEFIHKMTFNRTRILNSYEETQGVADETNIIELLKEFHDDVYPLIILAIAQKPSITAFCKEVINIYENIFKPRAALLPIITGNDLISEFNLEPSPIFKKILAEIENMTLRGRINSKEEALKIAKKLLYSLYIF
jgi:tRNA nucleotidyltransferase/poly(A) polymerase